MAIKVIKHGKETFKAICPICGCEFTYQSEDLKEDCFHNHYVECPDCKNAVWHEYEPKQKGLDKNKNVLWDYVDTNCDRLDNPTVTFTLKTKNESRSK